MAVIKRESSILIQFRYRGVLCRETLRIPPTTANLKHAKLMDAAIQRDIALGSFDYRKYFPDSRTKTAVQFSERQSSGITVAEALRAYLEGVEGNLARSTFRDYRHCVEGQLIPAFGDLTLSRLTVAVIRAWIANQPMSPKRINNILIPLRGMLEDAFMDGVIERNPMHRIKNLPVETEEPDPFAPDEIARILAACEGQIRNLFQFAFYTGLRTGELIALEWGDVDVIKGVLKVRRNVVLKEAKTPKTKSGIREVLLLPPALGALKSQREHTELQGGRVFHNPRTGTPWETDWQIQESSWKPALRRAKVRYRYPYQTRHTYASMLLTAGEDPTWIARQMGHADWSMIRKTYARWIPDAKPEAGRRVVEMLQQQAATTGDHTVITEGTS